MRLLIILSFFIGSSFISAKKIIVNELNGTWIPVKQEMNGTSIPEAGFQNQRLVIRDSNYTFTAESVDKGIAKFSNGKLDIYGKEGVNAGKHFTAIYKLENQLLTICYNLKGDAYPETFDSKGKPLFFVCAFKKENAK
ncbi:MAG TPA: TIGR03067 domain-containing protein [Puia sp.]|jgi:uncharacterized protein (TIGR03067 family)|nr:TIGR03067 domain-containing protein [Puia sp.]